MAILKLYGRNKNELNKMQLISPKFSLLAMLRNFKKE